jgi:hypothetical protein
MYFLLLFHYNNRCTNAPQYYVILTFPLFVFFTFDSSYAMFLDSNFSKPCSSAAHYCSNFFRTFCKEFCNILQVDLTDFQKDTELKPKLISVTPEEYFGWGGANLIEIW